uniref:Uncharacterized protein n=1 Tax=Meloidogyne hapla TaxID=6305 RepID=A0A1I8B672_MELHA
MKILSLLFLLIFVIDKANGMRPIYRSQKDKNNQRKGKDLASSSSPSLVITPDRLQFSLIELTYLTEILCKIDPNYIIINNNTLIAIINNFAQTTIYPQVENLYGVIPSEFNEKLETIFAYYFTILNAQQRKVWPQLISKPTQDIFVVWNLFGVARMLIRSFLRFHSENKYYDGILAQIWNIRPQSKKTISVFNYIKAFDEFEVKAERLRSWLEVLSGQVHLLQGENLEFSFNYTAIYYSK